jgi:two-component system sensor kinase FixL
MLNGENIGAAGPDRQHFARVVAASVALSIAYYVGVQVGVAFTQELHAISLVWPPNAIVLAALLLAPRRTWAWLIAAVLPVHLYAQLSSGVPLAMSLCWYVSNMAEALLGAVIITTVLGRIPRFGVVRDASVFLIGGVLVAPIATSFLDAAFVAWIGWRYDGDYWTVLRMRLFSNALAAIVLVPPVVVAGRARLGALRRALRNRGAEAAVLLTLLAATSWLVFHRDYTPGEAPPYVYAPLPLLLWGAVRLGVGGVAACIGIVAMMSIAGELRELGPFATAGPQNAVLSLQIFLIIAASSLMLLAAALEELRSARQTALRRKERLDLALSAAQLGVWEWDLTSDRVTWRLRPDAPSTTKTMGSVLELVHPDDRTAMATAIEKARIGEETCEAECRFIRGGSDLWMSLKGKELHNSKGGSRRIIGVCMDTTRSRQQIDRERSQREQLAHLSRIAMLGELSGALAHELSQPLSAILFNAQTALSELATTTPDVREVATILEDIVADDTRASEIIRRLRALFMRGAVQKEKMDIRECIRAVLVLERSNLIARKVATELDLVDGAPPVSVDPVQLQQVLLNLIANACEAMATMAEIGRRLKIHSRWESGMVRIAISDNGPGLSHPEKVFEPFYSTKTQGIGLGLAISRTIIMAHGGKLWATNNPEGGATFYVSLPAAARETSD